jgi:type I restriction enzyme, S subunit
MTRIDSSLASWKLVKCQDVIDVRDGTHDTPAKVQYGIPLITSKNLTANGLDFTEVTYISEKDYQSIEKRSAVDDGDILFAMIGTIGTPVIVKKDRQFSIKNVALFKLDKSLYYPPFFKELLNSPNIKSQLARNTRGGNQKFVSLSVLRGMIVPLPPLEEQKRIAEILDRAESLRAMRRQSIEQLNTLPEAIFLKMFGDPVKNPKNLSVEPLGDFLLFMTSGGRGWAQFYAQSGSRFIRSLDVQMNYIGDEDIAFVAPPDNAEARRTRVKTGDVLLTITGSRIGRVAAVPDELEKSYVSQHVAILRTDPNRISPMFLAFFLSLSTGGQRQIAKYQYGQTKPGLNFEQIKRFQIPLPSINLQQQFTQRVEAIEKLKTTHQESLTELDALFASLQHRAFRGEL